MEHDNGVAIKAESNPSLPSFTQAALSFEESRYTNGPVPKDSFYSTPEDSAGVPAGTLLKVESRVDIAAYLLPPAPAANVTTETAEGDTQRFPTS